MGKLPKGDIFDDPFKSTSTKKTERTLAVVQTALKLQKRTVYLSEVQWKAVYEEMHRRLANGGSPKSATVSRVIGDALQYWMQARKR